MTPLVIRLPCVKSATFDGQRPTDRRPDRRRRERRRLSADSGQSTVAYAFRGQTFPPAASAATAVRGASDSRFSQVRSDVETKKQIFNFFFVAYFDTPALQPFVDAGIRPTPFVWIGHNRDPFSRSPILTWRTLLISLFGVDRGIPFFFSARLTGTSKPSIVQFPSVRRRTPPVMNRMLHSCAHWDPSPNVFAVVSRSWISALKANSSRLQFLKKKIQWRFDDVPR